MCHLTFTFYGCFSAHLISFSTPRLHCEGTIREGTFLLQSLKFLFSAELVILSKTTPTEDILLAIFLHFENTLDWVAKDRRNAREVVGLSKRCLSKGEIPPWEIFWETRSCKVV